MTPEGFIAKWALGGDEERMTADLTEVSLGSVGFDPDRQARDLTIAMQRMNQFAPIHMTEPRAQSVVYMLENIDFRRDTTGDETKLRIEMAGVEATLVLAQEVSNLRQSLERLLRKETT